MKKQNKSQQIVAYKKANPKAKYREIAKAIGCDISLIGMALKKAGMTKVIKRRKVATKKPTPGQQVLRKVLKEDKPWMPPNLLPVPEVPEPDNAILRLSAEIAQMDEEIQGWKTIVSYLESKLGIDAHGTAI